MKIYLQIIMNQSFNFWNIKEYKLSIELFKKFTVYLLLILFKYYS